MIPVLFHLGPLTVYSFGLMMALGFLAADYVIRLECVRRGFDPEYSSSIVIAAAVAGLIGSRIYAILDDLPTYLADPKSMIFSGSGFVFYGGMIGGLLGAYLVSRWYRIGFGVTMDMCGPALAIGQAIGRMGCQLAGDGDWGLPSNVPWAMAYPHAIVGWNPQTVLKLDDHYQLVSAILRTACECIRRRFTKPFCISACLQYCGRCARRLIRRAAYVLVPAAGGSRALSSSSSGESIRESSTCSARRN